MEKIEAWQTSDGEIFLNEDDANLHEQEIGNGDLFKSMSQELMEIPIVVGDFFNTKISFSNIRDIVTILSNTIDKLDAGTNTKGATSRTKK